MKLLPALLLYALTICSSLYAQTDTTIKYYNAQWKNCTKDTATYISKLYADGDHYKQKDYWLKGMKLQMDANWIDEKFTRPAGASTWYNQSGTVTKTATYQNEKVTTVNYYFEDGKKKAIVTYDASGQITRQTGWEADGTEIRNYIYEQEARFPDGLEGWKQYLTSKMNYKIAAKEKAPVGVYTVKVQFLVNKEGKTEHIEAIEVPDACKKCGSEAVKIIAGSPKWQPAIQYGHPVIYQAMQSVSWQVEEQ